MCVGRMGEGPKASLRRSAEEKHIQKEHPSFLSNLILLLKQVSNVGSTEEAPITCNAGCEERE